MRTAVGAGPVTLPPGQPAQVPVEVTNTLEVIDGVTAFVDMGPGLTAAAEPALLPLFPDGTGVITLTLTASRSFPTGSYEVPVELRSSADPSHRLVEHIRVVVPPVPAATITAVPTAISSRHKGHFDLVVDNVGNVPLELSLAAADPNRALRTRFADPVLTVPPGESGDTVMSIWARRRLLGGEVSHQVSVVATAEQVEVDTKAVFRHRPIIPRGARTVMILAAIVAVWAGIFLVALSKALANNPLTKEVPASFYASSPATKARLSSLGGSRVGLAAADGGAPAGAVPKTGVVIGVGGTVSGTVEAESTRAGIGRITVEAFRQGPHGLELVSSAATGSDGTYSIVGLLPGAYTLEFSSPGYRTVWYPEATNQALAKPVTVDALAQTDDKTVVISGLPGSISGTVDTGQTPSPPVTVTVEPEQGSSTTPIATVKSNSSGHYVIPHLPTPGIYDLSYSAQGYQVGTDTEQLAGGQQEIANTVTLLATDGSITGEVTAGGKPLGGVMVTAQANGLTYRSATPTSGTVGQFILTNLPTPLTYLLTFSAPGYGTKSEVVHLGPGQNLPSVRVAMNGGAGQISGVVRSTTGADLGGVTVTVDGTQGPGTQSLTAGQVGSYDLTGLGTPGTYILTFSLTGYLPQTIKVTLGSSGSASDVDPELQPADGVVTGTVTSSTGAALSGVSVSATNGVTSENTTTSSSPPGGFTYPNLPAGSYSITFTLAGFQPADVTVVVKPGQHIHFHVTLISTNQG